ncbi:MAG: hypothetical protein ACREPA_03815 [Candidatus Dormibacteraceae bacterium]
MSRRTNTPKGRLVELLADEAERARRYPGIAFRGPDHRRRAWVIGSPFDVWEIVRAWQDLGEDAERVCHQLHLNARQLGMALAYHREFGEEIEHALALARRTLIELESAFPFFQVQR